MIQATDNLRIASRKEVIKPSTLLAELPMTEAAANTTAGARAEISKILKGEDDRMLVVVGPCSIHDTEAAMDYGRRLLAVKQELAEDLLIVMRVYFEKPRTTVGWKGLINDPDLNDSYHINKGLRIARRLLLDLNEMGLPAGVEFLDLISPQYISDLVSWGAIGARTTESQCHRELASGLSCPVGFKNGTDGNIKVAVDAVGASIRPHNFLGVTKEGHSAIFTTSGNEDSHIILRGGNRGPNYSAEDVAGAAEMLSKAGLPANIMVDFSHANSNKQHGRQVEVGEDIGSQIAAGNRNVFGVMIESHLVAGNQKVVEGQDLTYGQSITDACLGWDDTAPLMRNLAESVRQRRSA